MENKRINKTIKKGFFLAAVLFAGLMAVPALSWAWNINVSVGAGGYGHHRHNPSSKIMVGRHHPRHYEIVRDLPRRHKRVVVRGTSYYYHNGVFYRSGSRGYVVVNAPLGFTLGSLPHGYLEVRIGHGTFYYHNGNYYRWHPRHRYYKVVSAPHGAAVTYLPDGYSRVNIYGETYYKFNGTYYRMERINGDMMYVVTDI